MWAGRHFAAGAGQKEKQSRRSGEHQPHRRGRIKNFVVVSKFPAILAFHAFAVSANCCSAPVRGGNASEAFAVPASLGSICRDPLTDPIDSRRRTCIGTSAGNTFLLSLRLLLTPREASMRCRPSHPWGNREGKQTPRLSFEDHGVITPLGPRQPDAK